MSTSTAAGARGLRDHRRRPLAAGVVSGRTRWEELLLSLRFSARREPDLYNDYLVGLLKHADLAALRAVEAFEAARDPEDRFQLEHDGRRWRSVATAPTTVRT